MCSTCAARAANSVSTTRPDEIMKKVVIAESIQVAVPSSIEVIEESPVEDFVLVKFFEGKTLILSAYVGNAPAFPGPDCDSRIDAGRSGTLPSRTAIGKEGTKCLKEVLVDLGSTWPKFIHFAVSRGTDREIRYAESIIASVQNVSTQDADG